VAKESSDKSKLYDVLAVADGRIVVIQCRSNATGKPFTSFKERFFGTRLVQVVEDRQLKLEIFPDRRADQVADFTAGARICER
jgi:hypothetical protein